MKPTAVVGRRVVAFLLDGVIAAAINSAVFFFFANTDDEILAKAARGELDLNSNTYVNVNLGDHTYALVGSSAGLYFLFAAIVGFVYWVVLPGRTGWTPGKAALGLRIVRDDGTIPIGIGRSFVRQFMWIVDAFPYLIPYLTGFLTAMFSSRNKRVGDMLANTLVVRKEFAGASAPVQSSGLPESPPTHMPPAPGPGPTTAPAPVAPIPAGIPAGWHPDPQGVKRLRYWDGSAWTDETAD